MVILLARYPGKHQRLLEMNEVARGPRLRTGLRAPRTASRLC